VLRKHIKWDITGRCNLRCKHCLTGNKYKASFSAREKRELDENERRQVVDSLKKGGVHLINLLGGEPLVLDDGLFDLMKYSHDSGLRMTLNTNGTLLTGPVARKLFESGCRGLTVSIDGPDAQSHDAVRGKGTFQRIITNINHLIENDFFGYPVSFTINTVLNRHNMGSLEEMLNLCLSLKAHKWIILPLVVTGFASDNKNELILDMYDRIRTGSRLATILKQTEKNYHGLQIDLQFTYPPLRKLIIRRTGFDIPRTQHCCMAGTTLGFVDPYGILFPCDRIAHEFLETEINGFSAMPMSLLDHDFDEIWNQPYYHELFRFVSSAETFRNYDPCYRCEYLQTGLCIPCPLYGRRYEKVTYDFCLRAEKELGREALCLDADERKSLYRYSGQFESLSREKIPGSGEIHHAALLSLNLVKTPWVRENIQPEGAELYHTGNDTFYHLNYLGKEIWNSIDEILTVDQVLNHIVNQVPGTERMRVFNSGLLLINTLLEKNLLETK
jgi:MoaA/NifB/PqqE/SkfB family radical SAM enzyme